MAVSGISNYQDVLYKWQGQQLKSTGNQGSSNSAIGSLFSGASMTSQISSMVELTKYAMDAMGVSSDSRVTFSQITKYRQQLTNEFNSGVKAGLSQSGISDINSLTFNLDSKGVLTATGGSQDDRKLAQAWLDANPAMGTDLLASIKGSGVELTGSLSFRLSSLGSMTLVDSTTADFQTMLDGKPELSTEFRKALEGLGVKMDTALEFIFSDDGNLVVKGDFEHAEEVNAWLQENPDIAKAVKEKLEKNDIHESAVSLRLGKEGNLQISINNADNNDIQKALADAGDIGKKLSQGLDNLGIDPNINFSIQVNDDGSITVISDHPDRDKVQQFFDNNPDLVKKYRQIETLAGIDDARKAMQISPSEMRKRIQIESMASWWATSGDASSYFGNYNNGNLSLLSGLNMQV